MKITPVNGYILVEALEEEKNKLELPPEILSQNKGRSHGCVLVRLKEDFHHNQLPSYGLGGTSPFNSWGQGLTFGQNFLFQSPWKAGSILVIDVIGLETFKYEQEQYSIVNVKYVKGVIDDEHSEE